MENDSTIFQNPQGIWTLANKVLNLNMSRDMGYIEYKVDGRDYSVVISHNDKWDNDRQALWETRVRRNISFYVSGLFRFQATYVSNDPSISKKGTPFQMINNEFVSSKLTYGWRSIFKPGLKNTVEHHMMMIVLSGDVGQK